MLYVYTDIAIYNIQTKIIFWVNLSIDVSLSDLMYKPAIYILPLHLNDAVSTI